MGLKDMQIEGFTNNFDKLDKLQEQCWVLKPHGITHCTKHNTLFDLNEEPCWQCWDECREEI